MSKQKRIQKRRKTNKNTKRIQKKSIKRKVKGGDCGCTKSMNGGDFFNKGYNPSSSFDKVPIHSFYSQNLMEKDLLGGQHSSRLDPQTSTTPFTMGGKKRKTQKRNKTKKVKGGMNPLPSTVVQSASILSPLNPVTSAGDSAGSLMGYNIAKGGVMDYSNPILVSKNNISSGAMA